MSSLLRRRMASTWWKGFATLRLSRSSHRSVALGKPNKIAYAVKKSNGSVQYLPSLGFVLVVTTN